MKYQRISYHNLNANQQEAYNFQKVSAVLADFGFVTVQLTTDWNGADFLAIHKDGEVLKVQLKGRMTFDRKYVGKGLHVCFREGHDWYIYPHDAMLEQVDAEMGLTSTNSWKEEGKYSFPRLSEKQRHNLRGHLLAQQPQRVA